MRTKVNNKIVAMLCLVFVMSAVFVPELTLTVSAQNTADLPSRSVYTGTDDNSCKWSYDTTTGVLTVESNDSDAKTLHSLTGSNIDVVKDNASRLVLKKIDTVMPSVFKGYHFSTIEFCPELRWIRDNAFENNISLTGIDLIGTTLFWIEPSAFKGCTNLKSAVFPDTLRQINESAFEGCTALREVDLSNTGVYIIGNSAFKECTFLGKMLFPDTLETLGDYAIYKCGSISDSNTEIASRLKELDLRMVKKFGDHAVSENRWLTTISISKKIDEIGGSVTSTTFVGNGRSVSAANGYWDTYFYGTEDLFNSIPNLKDNPFPKAVICTEYPYPLWVGGTQVTIENCNDIPAAAPGNRTGKASYDPFKNILTLDGYKYTGPGDYKVATSRITAGIYSELADELTIELIGENEVIVEETTDAGNHDGIYSENDLVIKGSGSLDVEPGTGSGNSVCYGICFYKGLTIGGDCTVNARAPSGSKVKESIAILGGLNINNHLTIKDRCTVNAAGGDTSGADNTFSCGISIKNDIEITGGKVATTGGMAKYSHGIRSVSGATKIAPADNSAIEVEASGKTQAIYGNVINKISGVGWTNAGGTEGAETITKSDSARELNYKKVRFPAYIMIKATADPEEDGTVTGGGTYEKGETVTLKAEAKDGYVFVNWTEDDEEVKDESGQAAGATYTFDATKDRDLKANFRIPLTIKAKAQTYLYTGQMQGEGDTVYNDPDEIAAKVEVTGLKDGDKLAQIELFSEKKDVGVEKCIEAKGAKIMRGEGDAAVDVTGHYEITYVNGDMKIQGSEVKVKKTLDGRDWTDADSFEFTLSPVNGAPMPDGTTGDKITLTKADKDAGFTKGFGAIPFTQPGTYKYTLTETHKGETIKGVSYDSNDRTVTFEIKGDSKGNVVADGSTLLQTAEFTNTYNAKGEVSLKASKSVSGSDWPEGAEATFTLSSHDGAPMPDKTSVTLTASGDAEFGPISYDLSDAGKTYTYTISETGTKGFDDWFTDKESISVTVTVGTDKGDGTLSDASVTYTPEDTEITNTSVQWKFIDFTWIGDATTGYTEAAANYESTNTAGRTKTVKADISEEVTDPTCTGDGKTVYTAAVSKENSPDGEAHSESRDAKPTSKTGHSMTKTDEVPATCTKNGRKAYRTCSACNKLFSDEKGEHEITEPEVIKATGHTWDKGKVTKKATYKAKGVRTYTCTVCGATKEKAIAKKKAGGTALLKMTAKGKTSLALSWNKIRGADGYEIFFAKCNANGNDFRCEKIETIEGGSVTKYTKTGLKGGTPYKAYIKAYVKDKNGKKKYVKKSYMVHAFTGGYTRHYTNAKRVTVKKAKVTLKVKKTFKIKAKVVKLKKGKKLMPGDHTAKLRYLSTNRKVATVSKSGKIKARGKGKCKVYVIAHDVCKAVKVTVR